MRSKTRMHLSLVVWTVVCVSLALIFAVSFAGESRTERSPDQKAGDNSKCYVCHRSLKTEDISAVHLEAGISCDECHGPSVEHLEDEMLMTTPDLLFGRTEVRGMCSNSTCHKPGGDRHVYSLKDHGDQAAVKAFLERWQGRTRPNGRFITAKSICTDCHGTHNIVTQEVTESQKLADEWIAVFNGRDLSGWQSSGDASWTVKRSQIMAALGRKGKGGDLWTNAMYGDYQLSVTFRAEWPVRAGIWLRANESSPGPRVEIFESREPRAFTGSVLASGQGLVLVNLRDDLVDREGWNTISVEARGDRFHVWLNGEEVGVVRVPGAAKGRIGLHVERPPKSKKAELCVREVLIRLPDGPTEKDSMVESK